MTAASHAGSLGAASRDGEGAVVLGIAEWLGLAAAPTFAIMALGTGVFGAESLDGLCSVGHGIPLSGMVPMYLLMSAFHLTPWLRLIPSRRAHVIARSPCDEAIQGPQHARRQQPTQSYCGPGSLRLARDDV